MVLTSIFFAFAIVLQLIGRNFVNINPLLIGQLISTVILLTTYVSGIKHGIIISILIPATAVPLGALASGADMLFVDMLPSALRKEFNVISDRMIQGMDNGRNLSDLSDMPIL
jgi:hypothetical protein